LNEEYMNDKIGLK